MADITNAFERTRFNKHRQGITGAADAAAPLAIVKNKGVNASGYKRAVVDVVYNSGTFTSVVLQILFWSDSAAKFVPQFPDLTFTLSAAGQVAFDVDGRQFFVRVGTLTGAGLNIDIDVRADGAVENFD